MKSLELFAGSGGLLIGAHRAGFRAVAAIEWNRDACATLSANIETLGLRDTQVVSGDVRSVDFGQFRDDGITAIFGGPPCQPFSIGGKHQGLADERDMFPQAIRAVTELKPLAFCWENVRGLLRPAFADYFNYIVRRLRFPTTCRLGEEPWEHHHGRLEAMEHSASKPALQYHVSFRLFNAADFGAPQQRNRVFIVGIRSDRSVPFHFPAPTHSRDALLHDLWVSGDYWERHKVPKRQRPAMDPRLNATVHRLKPQLREMMGKPWRTVRDAIADLPEPTLAQSDVYAGHFLNPGARSYPGHDGSPLDWPAKALKAGDHGVPGGENMLRRPNGSVRYFTAREAARIQCFPDDWRFHGAWSEAMRQLGNAVPCVLGEAVAAALHSSLSTSPTTASAKPRQRSGTLARSRDR
jgi:DNA (cytosine-5)-methyltransferase 1